jgi:DNA (cytosine-5)-methyltransferase 3A
MKLLIGGSPCTHWSIAQTKHRETTAEGIGWELFLNYRIARDKYKPDYFLYENNKSMSPAIRAQITAELGVEPVLINSALVSAQNRQRIYWVGRRNPDGTYSQVRVEQPEDRGILLRDILETGIAWREKAYTLRASHGPHGGLSSVIKTIKEPGKFSFNGAAEPIIVNGMENGKARTVDAHMGKLENNLAPRINNPNPAKQQYDCIAVPVRIGTIENDAKDKKQDSQQYRVYSPDGKSVTLCGNGGGVGAKTGLYAVPMRVREATKQGYVDIAPGECVDLAMPGSKTRRGRAMREKSNCLTTSCEMYEYCGTLDMPIYQVRDGRITVKGKEYPIKLRDGCYIIRKLTVTEFKRLQTVPDTYTFPVSDTQAYKMLGNGWTVDVIAHIMSYFDGLAAEPVEVLSMYDGMSCGHIALDKLGVEVAAYYATEIDKYAIQVTQYNYPATVQLGDAFQVREGEWNAGA